MAVTPAVIAEDEEEVDDSEEVSDEETDALEDTEESADEADDDDDLEAKPARDKEKEKEIARLRQMARNKDRKITELAQAKDGHIAQLRQEMASIRDTILAEVRQAARGDPYSTSEPAPDDRNTYDQAVREMAYWIQNTATPALMQIASEKSERIQTKEYATRFGLSDAVASDVLALHAQGKHADAVTLAQLSAEPQKARARARERLQRDRLVAESSPAGGGPVSSAQSIDRLIEDLAKIEDPQERTKIMLEKVQKQPKLLGRLQKKLGFGG